MSYLPDVFSAETIVEKGEMLSELLINEVHVFDCILKDNFMG